MNHEEHRARLSVPSVGPIEFSVIVNGPFDAPDDRPLAEFLAEEILEAKELMNAWPAIGDEFFSSDGNATFIVVGRIFQSAKNFDAVCPALQYAFRQRGDDEVPAFQLIK